MAHYERLPVISCDSIILLINACFLSSPLKGRGPSDSRASVRAHLGLLSSWHQVFTLKHLWHL